MLEIHRAPGALRQPGDPPATHAGRQLLVRRLDVMQRPGQEPRHARADEQVVVVAVLDLGFDPRELRLADHPALPLGQDPTAARVDDEQADPPEVPAEGPEVAGPAVRLAVGLLRELAQQGLCVVDSADALEELVLGKLGRRQIPEVLVDPVRHEGAGDPLLPPGRGPDLIAPGAGRVPVIEDIVVVEDHRARDRREQPPDIGIGPRLGIEPGVFLEVSDLEVWRPQRISTRTDEVPGQR